MAHNLVFRWPKPLFFMVFGAHGIPYAHFSLLQVALGTKKHLLTGYLEHYGYQIFRRIPYRKCMYLNSIIGKFTWKNSFTQQISQHPLSPGFNQI